MKKCVLLISVIVSGFISATQVLERYWDWQRLDPVLEVVEFPKKFVFGCGTAELQISGADNLPDSQWAYWERAGKVPASGKACDSLNRRTEDIALLKKMGMRSYRFSVDWSLIEPREGLINEKALEEYCKFCDDLLAAGIEPAVTLHHFVHPQWFEEKGAFEKEENIQYFARFAGIVAEKLGNRVARWFTINEPSVYAFQAYIRGVYPPGVKWNFSRAGTVLKNLCLAHVAARTAMKKIDNNVQVSIAHQHLHFKAANQLNIPGRALSYLFNQFSDAVLEFFATGKFYFYVPLRQAIEADLGLPAIQSLDFIGLNYYSHVLIGLTGETYRSHEIRTDMPYSIYAEGLYDAIRTVARLKVPIYISENGIADKTDAKRDLWIKRYLYAAWKAVQEGYDVRGFYYWSLMDNYEWDMGLRGMLFGLCSVNFDTYARDIRPGAARFIAHAINARL